MTDAELTILSLLTEGPQHGYQLQQAIETRGMREWTAIGFSSVYYILNKLEKDGLLESKLKPSERGPARKVYSLTQAGYNVLQTAIADLLGTPREFVCGFTLGLANLNILRPEQIRHALDSYESSLRDRIAELNGRRARRAVEEDPPLHVVALFDYQVRLMLTELDWLQEFRQAWEAQAPPAPLRPDPFRAPVLRDASALGTFDLTPTPNPAATEQLSREEIARHKAATQVHQASTDEPDDEPAEEPAAEADDDTAEPPPDLEGPTLILPGS
ncbi:MAG: PadR family transcriptional regulator [Anaerolineae bacterium]|nr:PadR family transcriptional regulator [Anaerolineae bacterium]